MSVLTVRLTNNTYQQLNPLAADCGRGAAA
jgi:hypothetical protein